MKRVEENDRNVMVNRGEEWCFEWMKWKMESEWSERLVEMLRWWKGLKMSEMKRVEESIEGFWSGKVGKRCSWNEVWGEVMKWCKVVGYV